MIIVLKTNIFSQLETQVRAILDCFNQISTVDFDFEDVDNILRIEASQNITKEVASLLNSYGFLCEELV
ncbi:hypothetical protein [uncultured Lutibacter sp.]|uniref:hypothetical protein n=1 Tax=uncultured Lutibacter sp. TaxID=437739 RepID=UPI002630F6D1|nr:hypothetical protein [uncultured Lutibacter sp.]